MAERLVILSDMWGSKRGLWITSYLGYLQQYFDIVFYDCQQLANVDVTINTAEFIHNEFENGGVEIAAKHLLRRETISSHYLAFGIGGTIAYKAALQGLPAKSLYAISSSGIISEKKYLSCPVKMIFGQYDENRPSNEWTEKMGLKMEVVSSFGHELYTDEKIIKKICQELLGKVIQRQYQD